MSFYIFPFNGNALEIFDEIDKSDFLGFIDDGKEGQDYAGYKVFNRKVLDNSEASILYALGSENTIGRRESILQGLSLSENRVKTHIWNKDFVGIKAVVGEGSFLLKGTIISSNAVLGKCVGILYNSIVHHDCVVGDFTMICSGCILAGGVQLGDNCYVGSGAKIKPGIKIGNNVIIGMGAVVTKDIPDNSIVAGIPAKIINRI